jgi:hypothetical protein
MTAHPLSGAKVLTDTTVKEVVAFARRGATDRNIVIGPTVWQPSDGRSARRWYFAIATCGATGIRLDQVCVADKEHGEASKAAVIADLTIVRPPLVVHLVDDELYMARLCETLWPGERISEIRAAVEAERDRS